MLFRLWGALSPRSAAMRLAVGGLLVSLMGCAMDEMARTDQALGRATSLNAWVDPSIEPLTGCAALDGEWSNRGSLVRDRGVKASVFAAVIGLAKDDPDAVFADSVRLARAADGALDVSLVTRGREAPATRIPAAAINCEDPGVAVLDYRDGVRLTVDSAGGLWIEEHRFPPLGVSACNVVDSWTLAAPDGMATVVPGGVAMLWDAGAGNIARVMDYTTGVKVPPLGSFWLTGERRMPARAFFKPKSQWLLRLKDAIGEVTGHLESCHVYVLYGHTTATDQATLSLFDLGTGFAWRNCNLAPTNGGSEPVFDGRDLLLSEVCFDQFDGSWRQRIKGPRRRLSPMDEVSLRLSEEQPAEEKP